MQLDSKEAIRLGYVRDSKGNLLDPADYGKNSSIDITIGEVLFKDKHEEVVTGIGTTLKPQESLVIISNEIIHVPHDHIAYVFLKNSVSLKGLLALNTGIIDAGYIGPISTVIINFSSRDAVIPIGKTKIEKEFFRVVFHKIDLTTTSSQVALSQSPISFTLQDYEEYKEKRKLELNNFPKTFLEPTFLRKQIQEEINRKISDFSMGRVAFYVAILSVLFTFLPLTRDFLFDWKINIVESIKTKKESEIKINNLESDVEKLKEQIRTLELKADNRNK
ncbi:dCTP deaminase domain-containing protein [Mixta calida]